MKNIIEQLKEELEINKCQIFDVREIDEWNSGHLLQAQLQPLSVLKTGKLLKNTDINKKTYLYCRAGKRALPAAALLKAIGFKKVIPLKEGFTQLKQSGLK